MENRTIILKDKPGASLHLSTHFPAPASRGPFSDTLVVFLNGLGLPRASWLPAVAQFLEARKVSDAPVPPILCYDRYGQGDSEPDPSDPPGTPYGHEPPAVVTDLDALLAHVCMDEASGLDITLDRLRLVFVCNSIGCALARLFAAAYPGLVEGVLMLDSMVANTDFVSFFPDPDAPGFDPEKDLAEGVTEDEVRYARAVIAKFFHPTVPNAERLDRRRMAEFLPDADGPKLPAGPGREKPALVVVGHDFEEFSKQTEEVSSCQGFLSSRTRVRETSEKVQDLNLSNIYLSIASGTYEDAKKRHPRVHESGMGGLQCRPNETYY
jgi:pimeloyl-ACP methyl ester carboxylesterase